MSSMGSVMITAAAISPPQSTLEYEMKLKMAMGSVLVVSPASTSENMKLFHEKINDMIAAVTMPGTASGSTIRTNAPSTVAPSICADSSRSIGSPSKNGIIIQAMNGSPTSMWLRISAQYVPISPIRLKMMYHGIKNVMP